MASIEEAFNDLLTKDSAIIAQVQDRAYDTILPPETKMPAITFQDVSEAYYLHSTGTEAAHPVWVQVDCWGTNARERRVLKLVVHQRLRLWTGNYGGLRINRAILESSFNTVELRDGTAPGPFFRNVSRWAVHVVESGVVTP